MAVEIDSTYKVGPNAAGGCPDHAHLFCFLLNTTVMTDEGRLTEGCYLTWKLYRSGVKQVFETGKVVGCDGIYVGGNLSVPRGRYVIQMSVATDSGLKGSGSYKFTVEDYP
ncbi:hypothetical protein EV652_121114 [Kribbella steppae]|uniref:Uncharacterized protein n=1 Tax=Kribbella steppae TaxID=2512223 RepID=A0A4R2GX26_9ACTN|nr:hypothetical protein EV652_121114 [Kribbella steppae]